MKEGFLKFSESEGKYYITDEEEEEVLDDIEFKDTFQVFEDGKWIDTALEIGSNDKGELIFKLKNTKYAGYIEGIKVRK